MGYKRYERYKDSGVEWIGEVPEGWEIKRIKHFGILNPKYSRNKNIQANTEVSFIPMDKIISTGVVDYSLTNTVESLVNQYTYCENGDIIVAKVTPCFENGNIAIVKGALNGIGFGTTELHVLRCKNGYSNRFLFYYLQSHTFKHKGISEMYGAAGLKRVPTDFISNYKLGVPGYKEQQSIANFLDQKTAEIDSLIADKEKMVQLLQEMRQAIISEAVTEGLDKNVKMKDSGVEWIGEIPEHWEVKKIKHISSFIGSGKTPRGGSEVYSQNGVIFIRSQNVYPQGLILDDVVFISEDINLEMKNTRVKHDDVLLNITGASIGRSSFVQKNLPNANVNQHVCIIRHVKQKVVPALLHKIVCSNSVQNQIQFIQNGTSREGLNFKQVSNLIIVIPTCLDEQVELIKYIDKKIAEIDSLIKRVLLQIAKLQEYRQSLISEAVTGKIDVRDIGQSTEGGVQNDCNAS